MRLLHTSLLLMQINIFLDIGDEITLKEAYEDDTYTFSIEGIYDYEGGLTVFLPQNTLNELFDLGSDYFSGYLSDSEITDINRNISVQ